MKTITRTLAFVLVIALAFSLTTAFAASYDDYTDAADAASSDYAEAIDFCVGIGVINGMSDTQLGLDGTLTRAQAAKIVTYCKLGEKAAESLAAADTQFTDTVGHWALKYISYCASENIINGMNDTTFAPEGTLTGYQFAKMLLSSLGYGKEGRTIDGTDYVINNYTGEYWATKVSADGNKIGLFEKLDDVDLNGEITRAEAMQMAFNAYGIYLDRPEGVSYYTKDNADFFYNNSKLKCNDGERDVLGRPAHYWTLNNETVTDTYQDTPVLTFVYPEFNQDKDEYDPSMVAAFLADQKDMKTYMKDENTAKKGYTFPEAEDAPDGGDVLNVPAILNNATVTSAMAGWEIEVYVTEVEDGDDIVAAYVIPHILAQVTDTNENAKAKEDEDWTVSAALSPWQSDKDINVYDKNDTTNIKDREYYVAENIGDFKKDQYVIVTPVGFEDDKTVEIVAAESKDGTVTATNHNKAYLKLDGTQYFVNFAVQNMIDRPATQDGINSEDEATFYLLNGYIVGYGEVKSEKADTFVYVEDIQYQCASNSFSNDVFIKLDATFTDGSNQVINLPVTKKSGTYDGVEADYYYTFDGEKTAFVDHAKATWTTDKWTAEDFAIVPGWYAYTKDDEGNYKLFNVNEKDQFVYSTVDFKDKNATVAFDTEKTALATADTVVTFIDDDNNVTTVKGFKNFSKDDSQGTEGRNCVLVVYNLDSKDQIDNIANIYVFDADAQTTETDYVYANGFVEKSGSDMIFGWFEDGKYVEYVANDSNFKLEDGCSIYTLDINSDNKFDATAVKDKAEDTKVVTEGIVKSVTDGYIKIAADEDAYDADNTTVIYIGDDTNVYDISAGDNAISTGTLAAKNVVTLVAEWDKDVGDFVIADAFILEGKYTDYDFE